MGNPIRVEYGVSLSRAVAPESIYPGLLTYLYYRFSVPVEGHRFSEAYRRGKWDGSHHFVSHGGRFQTGMLPQVVEEIQKRGYTVEVVGKPPLPPPPENPPRLVGIDPHTPDSKWWFQWESAVKALKEGRGVIRIPTGAGKTQTAALMTKAMPGLKVLFLVDSIDLLDQTAEKFESLLGEPVSRIGDGSYGDDMNTRVCVSTIQTLKETKDKETKKVVRPVWVKNPNLPRKWLRGVDMVFVDECHSSTTDAFVDVIKGLVNAHFRYGLSATPFARDDMNTQKLIGECGDIVVNIPGRFLIDLGILAEPHIFIVSYGETDDLTYLRNSRYDYGKAYDRLVCTNDRRNEAIVQVAAHSDSVLILVKKKSMHGKVLYERLTRELPDKAVLYLSGDTSGKMRSRGRKAFLQGTVDILIATSIFDKGVDLPNIRTLVLAGSGKSTVGSIQRLGRGMRATSEKDSVMVYDFMDDTCEYLLEHAIQRMEDYSGEGYELHSIST